MDDISSYLDSLELTEGEDQFGNHVPVNNEGVKRHDLHDMNIYGTSRTHMLKERDESRHNQQNMDPVTRSTVAGSSCPTTMSLHSGPTYQSTRAPLGGHTGFRTQMSTAVENSLGVPAHLPPEKRAPVVNEVDGDQQYQQPLHMDEGAKERVVSNNSCNLQSQIPPANNSSLNVEMEPSQSSKVDKAPRKKKYDPDVFFKVNGKLYQKLGKIGSGGSSEVHKVITSDCTIYALKKIKLKGRDYPTAYGFCQEIEYLNKLKGKNNIIQLIAYEVQTLRTMHLDKSSGKHFIYLLFSMSVG